MKKNQLVSDSEKNKNKYLQINLEKLQNNILFTMIQRKFNKDSYKEKISNIINQQIKKNNEPRRRKNT